MEFSGVTGWVMLGVRALILLTFLFFGWRELALLFRRPSRNMGTGLSRAWAVARTTMFEAWAGRVWLLPVLWLIASLILLSVIRPFDESERMPLNIRTLLTGQELLILVMMWVMASLSLPRERERKIIITNASKPLSRLEIVLGKIVGFSATAGLMLLIMGIASYVLLLWQDHRIKTQAAEAYKLQVDDFSKKSDRAKAGEAPVVPPSESTRRLAEEGSLYAYNYIPVRKGGMSILGNIDLNQSPPLRYIKGGSYEKAIYRFPAGLQAEQEMMFAAVGTRPFFRFYFPIQQFAEKLPRVQLRISAYCSNSHRVPPPKPIEKMITLNDAGEGFWEPNDPGELYTFIGPEGIVVDQGEVTLEITCMTPGVNLQILDGAPIDPATGAYPADAQFNMEFVPQRAVSNRVFPPEANPVVRGYERRDRQEINGPSREEMRTGGRIPLELALFRFSGEDLKNVRVDSKGNFPLTLNLYTYKQDNADRPTEARIRVISYDRPAEAPFSTSFEIAEKRNTIVNIPSQFLGNTDASKRGDMIVMVSCPTPFHAISFLEDSVRIELPQTPFFINLLKTELIIFFETVLLITIAVACSVRVGWPVAMLCSCVCVLFGFFVEFIASLQEYGGLGSLNYRRNELSATTYQFFDTFTSGIWKALGVIASFVPNFTVYAAPQTYISLLHNMPWSVLASNALTTLVFLIPCVAIAFLLFRKQELG